MDEAQPLNPPKGSQSGSSMIISAVWQVLTANLLIVLLLLAAIFASVGAQLYPAFLMRRIIDENFAKGLTEGVWRLSWLYLLTVFATNLLQFTKVAFTTILGQKILMDMRARMAKRLSELSIAYFVRTPTGEIMSRLTTDVDAINNLFSAGIINVISDLFRVFGLLVSLYALAPHLIWLELIAIVMVFICSDFFRKEIFKWQRVVRLNIAAIYTFIQEWLTGIRTIKTYAIEPQGRSKFQGLLFDHLYSINAIARYDSWFPCVMQTLRAVFMATALWLCVPSGSPWSLGLSVGTLAAVSDLIGRLFAPIEALAQEFQTIQQSMAGIARINEFAAEPVEDRVLQDQEIDNSAGIEIEDLSFAYGERNVLQSVRLSIPKGEKAVIVGRSGAGKTTLMNLIAGLYHPGQGKISICGVDPFTLPPEKRRKLIGIVPQMPQIFDGTVAENIRLMDDNVSRDSVETAAKTVGMHETIMALSEGYETQIGEGATGLSSGEVQLLSLARAIVADPMVLLLDEPTSGMDAKTEQRVFAAIRAIGENRTIFSISHRLSGIIDADTIHLMAEGRVVESGTADELIARDGWYAMYQKMERAGWLIE